MCLSSRGKLSKSRASRFETIIEISMAGVIVKTAFILATVIDAEVVKTKVNFLAFRATNL